MGLLQFLLLVSTRAGVRCKLWVWSGQLKYVSVHTDDDEARVLIF